MLGPQCGRIEYGVMIRHKDSRQCAVGAICTYLLYREGFENEEPPRIESRDDWRTFLILGVVLWCSSLFYLHPFASYSGLLTRLASRSRIKLWPAEGADTTKELSPNTHSEYISKTFGDNGLAPYKTIHAFRPAAAMEAVMQGWAPIPPAISYRY